MNIVLSLVLLLQTFCAPTGINYHIDQKAGCPVTEDWCEWFVEFGPNELYNFTEKGAGSCGIKRDCMFSEYVWIEATPVFNCTVYWNNAGHWSEIVSSWRDGFAAQTSSRCPAGTFNRIRYEVTILQGDLKYGYRKQRFC